jgi:hypothetical protein
MATKITTVKISNSNHVTGAVRDTFPPYVMRTVTENTNYVSLTTNNRFDGVSNPGWRSQVKRHAQAGTAASGYKATATLPKAMANARTPKLDRYNAASGAFLGGPSAWDYGVTFSDAEADSAARLALLNKFIAQRRSFQTGVFMGELVETIHMIRHPAQAFRKGLDVYHQIVKKRLRGTKSLRAQAALVGDAWLEQSFGWGPLVNDIRDGMKALAETVSGKYYGDVISAKASVDEPFHATTSIWSPIAGISFKANWQTTGTVTVRYKGGVGAVAPTYPAIRTNWGITFSEIVPTIYEHLTIAAKEHCQRLIGVLGEVKLSFCSVRQNGVLVQQKLLTTGWFRLAA